MPVRVIRPPENRIGTGWRAQRGRITGPHSFVGYDIKIALLV